MEFTRCTYRLISRRLRPKTSPRKQFSTSLSHNRLGAFTYAQEWQTGSYHFNKATTKTYPVAAQHTDELLQNWFTQRRKKQHSPSDPSDPTAATSPSSPPSAYAQQLRRNEITAQRRKTDRVLVSHSTAKDFGERMEVTAFVYDGIEAAEAAKEKRRLARQGVKDEGGQSGARRRAPIRRRGAPGGGRGQGAPRFGFTPGTPGPGFGPGTKMFSFGRRTGGSGGMRGNSEALGKIDNAGSGRGGAANFRGPRTGGAARPVSVLPKPAAKQ